MSALLDYYQAMVELVGPLRPHIEELQTRLGEWHAQADAKTNGLEPLKRQLLEHWSPHWNPDGPPIPITRNKEGYLFKRRMKGIGTPWKRVWACIERGHFIISNLSSRETIETRQELDVLLAEIKASDAYDRKWCFEILTTQQTLLVFQAESEDELKDWIKAFQNSKTNTLVEEEREGIVHPIMEQSLEGITRNSSTIKRAGETEERSLLMRRFPQLRDINIELFTLFEDTRSTEICLLSFPAAVHRCMLGRVFVTQERMFVHSVVFGVETRTIIALHNITRLELSKKKFWLACQLTLADGSGDSIKILEEGAEGMATLLERIIDARRSVRKRTIQDLLNDLFPSGETEDQEQNGAKADCGCEDHLERTLYDSILPFTLESAIEKLFGRESWVVQEFMERQKYTNASMGEWTDESLPEGSTRLATFRVPNPLLKGRDTLTCETWTISKHTPDILIIDKTAKTPEALYGDCFSVNIRYCLTRYNDSCRMVTSAGMHWFKNTIMKSIIRATANRITDEAILQMNKIIEKMVEKEGTRPCRKIKGLESSRKRSVSVSGNVKLGFYGTSGMIAGLVVLVAFIVLWMAGRCSAKCVLIQKDKLPSSTRHPATTETGIIRAELFEALAKLDTLDDQLLGLSEL